jgi:glycerol-3-phosphate acyltransferase PlsY
MLRFLPNWNLVDVLCRHLGWTGDAAFTAAIVGILLCVAVGYLLGSLNSAIIISRLFLHRDIRAHGSKNAGATNMLRTYGTKYAVMTLVLDMLKAAVATTLGFLICNIFIGAPIAGFFCVFGHMFPLYYRFKGGKGVACTAIVALMLDPWTFLVMFFCFFAIVLMTRYVSLASIMCAFLYPLLLGAFFPGGWVVLMGILTTCFVVFMHRENIKRLYNGKESKISLSFKKKSPPSEGTGGNG